MNINVGSSAFLDVCVCVSLCKRIVPLLVDFTVEGQMLEKNDEQTSEDSYTVAIQTLQNLTN